ncbi:MAG TPA: YkvA family protein [Phycisphaerales bacterium]|nr:YkvA family protein [Phycisphaerales bacterium]
MNNPSNVAPESANSQKTEVIDRLDDAPEVMSITSRSHEKRSLYERIRGLPFGVLILLTVVYVINPIDVPGPLDDLAVMVWTGYTLYQRSRQGAVNGGGNDN